jgi:hypothetical protein
VLKWASGHERWAYVVILHGSDEDWMRSSDFDIFINDYIDKAPADVPNRCTYIRMRAHARTHTLITHISTHTHTRTQTHTNKHTHARRAFDKAYMRYHGQKGQSDAYYTSQIGKLYAREVCAHSRSLLMWLARCWRPSPPTVCLFCCLFCCLGAADRPELSGSP